MRLLDAGAGGWTDTEKSQLRYRLGIDGSSATPAALSKLSTKVIASFAYDESVSTVEGNTWLEQDGRLLATVTSATASFYGSDGTLLFPALTDSAPDAQGIFRVSKVNPGFVAGDSIYVVVQIVAPSGTFTTVKGLQIVG